MSIFYKDKIQGGGNGDLCHVLPINLSLKSSCCIRTKVCKDKRKTWLVLWGDSEERLAPQAGSLLQK